MRTLLLAASLHLLACDGGSGVCPVDPAAAEVGRQTPPTAGNNSAHFDGLSLGQAPSSARALPVRLVGPNQGLVAGPAFLAGDGGLSRFFLRLENRSGRRLCYVGGEGLRFFDGCGELVGHEPSAFVQGSVGAGTLSVCLAPGEASYSASLVRLTGEPALVDLVVNAGWYPFEEPATSVVPEDLVVDGDLLRVTVRNVGREMAELGDYHQALAFDERGWPMGAELLSPCEGDVTQLAPEATTELCLEHLGDERVSSVHVFVDFRDRDLGLP